MLRAGSVYVEEEGGVGMGSGERGQGNTFDYPGFRVLKSVGWGEKLCEEGG